MREGRAFAPDRASGADIAKMSLIPNPALAQRKQGTAGGGVARVSRTLDLNRAPESLGMPKRRGRRVGWLALWLLVRRIGWCRRDGGRGDAQEAR